jgi:hypothetical protein
MALTAGAVAVWWVGRRVAVEGAALRRELAHWDQADLEVEALRADAREVRARYRDMRRR